MNYTENEMEALLYYSSRKQTDFLKMNLGYKGINGFVKYLSQINSHNNSIPGNLFMTSSSLKEMVLDIVDLYTLCCKYGYTHKLPQRLYRGDNGGGRIESNAYKNGNDYYWSFDQFISCTKSFGEARVFSRPEDGGQLITIDIPNDIIIPFVDVNDILPASQEYSDEREILFPPYYSAKIVSSEQNYKTIELTNEFITPNNIDTLEDSFFEDYLVLSNSNKDKNTNLKLDEYRKRLNSFLISQFDYVNTIFLKYSYGLIDEEGLSNELEDIRSYIASIGEKENKMN